jgi:hypothetical protein
MVMAGYENRERDEDQRGDQTASPPSILLQDLLFETVQAPFETLFHRFSLIYGVTWFIRHRRFTSLCELSGSRSKRTDSRRAGRISCSIEHHCH